MCASGLQLSGGKRQQVLQRLLREHRQAAIHRLPLWACGMCCRRGGGRSEVGTAMQGEGLDNVSVSERGLLGDRAYALMENAFIHLSAVRKGRSASGVNHDRNSKLPETSRCATRSCLKAVRDLRWCRSRARNLRTPAPSPSAAPSADADIRCPRSIAFPQIPDTPL